MPQQSLQPTRSAIQEVDERALPAAPPPPAEMSILGIPLALTDYERTIEWIARMVASGERGYVCVANVHTVMACQEDAELRRALLEASLRLPDGQPLVWAANALGHDLAERVYGP